MPITRVFAHIARTFYILTILKLIKLLKTNSIVLFVSYIVLASSGT